MPYPGQSRVAELRDMQSNVRSLLREIGSPSSLYSRSANGNTDSEQGTPRLNNRGFFARRWPTTTADTSPDPDVEAMAETPLRTNPAPINYSPASQPSEWNRHPADVELAPGLLQTPSAPRNDAGEDAGGDADAEAARPSRSRRHRKKKRRHRQAGAWIRRHGKKRRLSLRQLMRGPTRTKFWSSIVACLFLALLLAVYLAVALTVKGIGQELHILFVLAILATASFFAHTLVGLFLAATRPPTRRRRQRIPSVSGPMGFRPAVPIRVHLARDDEIVAQNEEGILEPEKLPVKQPPPAYGLWRCSVRVDPNLLHWQRVNGPGGEVIASSSSTNLPKTAEVSENLSSTVVPRQQQRQSTDELRPSTAEGSSSSSTSGSPTSESEPQNTIPRPPSYVSEDGVTYIMAAQPRPTTTVYYQRPPSELHPAFRNQNLNQTQTQNIQLVPVERCA